MQRQYNRFFITLRQDRSDYSLKEREALGSLIIDAKGLSGKVSITVQNLKTQTVYKAYLINCEASKSIAVLIGTVNIDLKGKGELKWEFDADDVGGSGLSIEKFSVAAILVNKNGEIISPLVGYKNDKVMWKNNFEIFTKEPLEKKKLEVQQPVIEEPKIEIPDLKMPNLEKPILEGILLKEGEIEEAAVQETVVQESVVQEAVAQETVVQEAVVQESFTQENIVPDISAQETPAPENVITESIIQEPAIEELKEVESNTFNDDVYAKDSDFFTGEDGYAENKPYSENQNMDFHNEFKKIANQFNKEMETLNNYTFLTEEELEEKEIKTANREYINPKEGNDLDFVFKHHIQMNPFAKQNKIVKWVKISIKELALLPIETSKYINNPFLVAPCKKYKHLLLGETDDVTGRKYILAVPDIYDRENKSTAANLGFVQFKCCDDVRPVDGTYGYWLLPIVID